MLSEGEGEGLGEDGKGAGPNRPTNGSRWKGVGGEEATRREQFEEARRYEQARSSSMGGQKGYW